MDKTLCLASCARRWLAWLALAFALPALAQESAPPAGIAEQVQAFADAATRTAADSGGRVEVSVGQLDPRLRLAPCTKVEPYLPNGARLWGRAHIGVRCLEGPKAWNVYLPITVKVYGRALVATSALPAGAVLTAADVTEAEVDLAAESGTLFTAAQAPTLVGRSLLRPVAAGQGLRSTAMKVRQWFNAGDTVRITAQGAGFAVEGTGEALSVGIEGQSARIRTEGGRVISATPTGEREAELTL